VHNFRIHSNFYYFFFTGKENTSVSDHVKVLYKETRYKTSQDDWPPEQPQHFTSVTIIYHRKWRTKREVIAVADVTISGSVAVSCSSQSNAQRLSQYGQESSKDYMKQSRITKSIAEIFEPFEDTDMKPPSSILIEGAPGIGKTVLSKEIAYKWAVGGKEKILQDKKLVFLVYMRDPAVAKIKTIEDLVHCFYRNDPSAKDIAASCGRNLLSTEGSELALILDGYDEMPKKLRTTSLFADIINRTTLPRCTLVITSRPSSSAQLHSNMERRMEILGFTDVDRKDYIHYALKGLDDQIEVLLRFLLNHPTVNSLCYIPLNMTILLYLLKHSELSSLPTSQTSLYQDFICLTVCHHLRKKGIVLNSAVTNLKSLPEPYYSIIHQLAKLSFIALEKSQLVFSLAELKESCPEMDAIPGGINCFGLLQAVEHFSTMQTTLSFNLVHFSVQEFLAAFYISSLPIADELKILQQKFWVGNYYNTWIIYIGFTKGQNVAFKTFLSGDQPEPNKPTISVEFLKNTRKCLHLFQCFDEAEDREMCRQIDKAEVFESGRINVSMQTLTPMEMKSLCVFLTKSSRRQWEELSLSSCYIGDTGCSLLEVSLSTNAASIESVRLEDNQLTALSTETVVKMATHCRAILLDLRWNELQDGSWSSLADNTSLLGVILDGNNLRDSGARKIMAAVSKNSTLNLLRLDDNSITDKVTDDIAAALANNISLNALRLCKNPLSDIGSTTVLHSLMSNKVLEWLWLPTPLSDSTETALREKEDAINNYRLHNKCNVKLTIVFF